MIQKMPHFKLEKYYWEKGFGVVAGLDEVGRGCFAGPVCAGCVAFPANLQFTINNLQIKIDDSKKLTPIQREIASKWIKKNALTWGIGVTGVNEINKLGIGLASMKSFRKAISNANKRLSVKGIEYSVLGFLLIDAFYKREFASSAYIPYTRGIGRKRQLGIFKGDQKSMSIAAASIIAKVYRDKLICDIAKKSKYQLYGWDSNKGYGTKAHREAIIKYGTTNMHRRVFINTWLSK